LRVQPTLHRQSDPEYCLRQYPALLGRCIVGCIFGSVGLIVTREIPCISVIYRVILKVVQIF
jgi:hypothetical protein